MEEALNEQNETKKNVSFSVYRGKRAKHPEIYDFVIDKNGNPEKVGDGTYGAVFAVKNVVGDDYVIKIFYEMLTTPRLKPLKLTDTDIGELEKKLVEFDDTNNNHNSNDKVDNTDKLPDANEDKKNNSDYSKTLTALKELSSATGRRPFGSIGELVVELHNLNLSPEHLRIVLNHFQSSSTPFEQFTKEMTASEQMRISLDNQPIIGVVDVEGSTKVFKESAAFKAFKESFVKMQIDISNYAIVMKRYQYTLKDVLENPRKPRIYIRNSDEDKKLLSICKKLNARGFEDNEELKEAIRHESGLSQKEKDLLESSIYRTNGYDILKSLDFDERVRTILPFLRRIVQGVRTIHKAEQYHFDLKPANIFVNDKEGIPDVVVGDLGAIQQKKPDKGSLASTASLETSAYRDDLLLLGTRHYRSPEQKDYFDVCYVKVMDSNLGVVLKVTDRKFKDTIIETGDYVVFSKASNPSEQYTIEKIITNDSSNTICDIVLSSHLKQMEEDDKTQVILYKKQSARTDLFGIGAIAFDLVTCGESPERFYDSIRNYDNQKESVQNLRDKYTQLTQVLGAGDATTRSIFRPFMDDRSHIDSNFVDIILKCMLYQAKGTYYNPDGDLASSKLREEDGDYYFAVEAVLNDIDKLSDDDKFRADAKNKLLPSTLVATNPPAPLTYLYEELIKLQVMSSQSELPQRLAQGMNLFDKIFDLVSSELGKILDVSVKEEASESHETEYFSFAEMVPQNIKSRGEKEFDFRSRTYQTYQEYKEDLRDDYFDRRINSDAKNPYVPLDLTAPRRQLRIQKTEDEFCRYSFLDSSPVGGSIRKDDWIVGNNMLWQVEEVHEFKPHHIKLKRVFTNESSNLRYDPNNLILSDANFKEKHYHYQNLDPTKYYINMLGIYLHQIFFANIGKTTVDRPEGVYIAQKVINVRGIDKVKVIFQVGKFNANFDEIVKLITQMYLRTTMYGHIESSSARNAEECFNAVRNERDNLRRIVGDFLGVHPDDLYKVDSKPNDWLEKNTPENKIINFDFNELILNFVRKNNFRREILF